MGIRTRVNISVKDNLSQKQLELGRYTLANQMLADMDIYTPFKKGILSSTGRVLNDGKTLEWHTPYAHAQFVGIVNGYPVRNYTTTHHPQASKRWDLKAKGIHMESWERVLLKGLGL